MLGWVVLVAGVAHSGEATSPGAAVLATVGEQVILRPELEVRVRLNEIRGEDSTPDMALIELLRESLEREVGRRTGVEPGSGDLEVLDHHARETTRAPDRLRAILALFGDDPALYRRHVLAPRAQSWMLREALRVAAPAGRPSFEEWYRQAAASVPIHIVDAASNRKVCEAYGKAWWLQSACRASKVGEPASP